MQRVMALTAWGAALLAGAAVAQQPAPSQAQQQPQEHVRGDVVAFNGDTLEVKSRSGETVKLKLADNARVSLVSKADMSTIQDGGFIGTTAVPQKDGSLRAVEVHVFPEAMRGTGEGHRPWDLQPGSTMTNATVAKMDESGGKGQSQGTGSTMTNANVSKVEESGGARKLSLKYKDGEKTVLVPPGTPVVKIEPGDKSKLVPGAHVFVIATKQPDGTLVAQRMNVGKDGLVPPM